VRFLMIEDNADNAYLARFLLEHRGHQVSVATTGAAGIALGAGQRFDAILLDLRLPDGDGCDFVAELLEQFPPQMRPIIAVSAHALPADHARAIAVGCTGFIEKPINTGSFVDHVEKLAGDAG
jgi:two-component system cell cycle response regulator DivK